VIDGDTYDMLVDLGFRTYAKVRVRLHGIDVYERHTDIGRDAIAFVVQRLREAGEIRLQSYKDEHSFERWVCDIWIDGVPLATILRDAGYEKQL
jgi:micrococcal nuclease